MNEESLMERADKCYKRLRLPGVKEAISNMLDDPENSKKSPLEWIVLSFTFFDFNFLR